jgi:hypothetical protein
MEDGSEKRIRPATETAGKIPGAKDSSGCFLMASSVLLTVLQSVVNKSENDIDRVPHELGIFHGVLFFE